MRDGLDAMSALVALLAGTVLAAGALTGALRNYAVRRKLVDFPNARSSHTAPTPRGGGLAIVVCVLILLPLLAAWETLDARHAWAVGGAGLLVAAIGFADDHRHIAARWRLLAHFTAAAWALALLGGAPAVMLLGHSLTPGWATTAVAAVFLVWMLNLYNFMDGIDGIAGVEAITVCLGAALLYGIVGSAAAALQPLVLAAAVAGFLYWNLPPARIFMGDVGSGFLGIVLGVMSLQAGWTDPKLLWGWLILLGAFVVDATLTLLWRLLRGEKVYQAHRSHAYQHAALRIGRHLPVTLAVGAINLFWLLPIALWVAQGRLEGALGLILAYTPLIALATYFRAGRA